MPLTTLDAIPALIIVDLQKGIAARLASHPSGPGRPDRPTFATVVNNSRVLAAEFRTRNLPVVVVTAAGGASGRTEARRPRRTTPSIRSADWSEPIDDLHTRDSDIRIIKRTWGAFHRTGLADALAARNITQVIITGVATSIGVESTARSAHEHGLNVVLATDAMTDPHADAHHHSLTRIFPRLGETATTSEILTQLVGPPPMTQEINP